MHLTASVTSEVAVRCPLSTVALDELIDLALDHRGSARTDQIDLGRCLVDADNGMPAVGETGGTNSSHIAKSEHTNPHTRCSTRSLSALASSCCLVAAATRRASQSSRRMGLRNFQRAAAEFSELGVGVEQLRLLVVPGKRVFHALAAILAHAACAAPDRR